MKQLLICLLPLAALACSPIPDLAGVFQVSDGGIDSDGGLDVDMDRGGRRPTDMGMMGGTAPCPMVFGATSSFCYWSGGAGDLNIATALVLVGTDPNCVLAMGKLSVNAATATCTAEFDHALAMGWGIDTTSKAAHLSFSYSIKMTVDHAILAVDMPSGSPNELIKINGITGNANVLNLYSPMGTMFAPGFSMSLGGAAKKATVSLDWISVWQ